jgi:ABC-type Na+ transport system ATPase subunit NatA
MSEQQTSTPPAAERVYERCLCREAIDRFGDLFQIHSDEARTHMRNSRIEFLKAVRSLIDDRIAHLSSAGQQQGTKVSVE